MKPDCIGQPVSWLKIERFVLAELPDEQMSEIRQHLDACPACHLCEAEARAPRRLPPLPIPSEVAMASPAAPRRVSEAANTPPIRPARFRRVVGGFSGLLAAAAALLLVFWPPAEERGDYGPNTLRVRGGEVSLTLVRERDGMVETNAEVFSTGDRWKVLITCPPGHPGPWAVWLIQDGRPSLALSDDGELRCGNRVPMNGAFHVTGTTEATLCAVWGIDALGPDESNPSVDTETLRSSAVCRTLRPTDER